MYDKVVKRRDGADEPFFFFFECVDSSTVTSRKLTVEMIKQE